MLFHALTLMAATFLAPQVDGRDAGARASYMDPRAWVIGPIVNGRNYSRGMPLHEIELEAVRITLRLTNGNQSEAARVLGVSRPTLARKMREAGILPPDEQSA